MKEQEIWYILEKGSSPQKIKMPIEDHYPTKVEIEMFLNDNL